MGAHATMHKPPELSGLGEEPMAIATSPIDPQPEPKPRTLAPDDRIVAEGKPFEIIDGRLVVVPPSGEPHGNRQIAVGALITAHLASGWRAATEMLTRVAHDSDFAAGVAIYREGKTADGARHMEEIAIEIKSSQSWSDLRRRAELLTRAGVRILLVVDVVKQRAHRWNTATERFDDLDPDTLIDDEAFVTPVPVRAMLDEARVDAANLDAMRAKGLPELAQSIDAARGEGEAQGLARGKAESVVSVLAARRLDISDEERDQILSCTDLCRLDRWLTAAVVVGSVAELLET